MEFSLLYIFAAVLFTECFAGITVNMIIVAVNVRKWRILKSFNTCDKALSCLAGSRTLYLLSIALFFIFDLFYPQFFQNIIFLTTFTVNLMILNYTNLWFATVLCVFYCVKITNYNWKFFLFLKTKISTLVPWFLLASLVMSVCSALPYGWCFHSVRNITHASMNDQTSFSDVLVTNRYNQFLIITLGTCPPFMTFCIANLLFIHSLRMHTRRMRSTGSSPNLEAHFRAVKSMSLFLMLNVMYFIFMNILLFGILNDYQDWHLISVALMCSPSFIHSLYIIYSSTDLQKAFISMFYSLPLKDTACLGCIYGTAC